jgi:hypothetical protein
MFLKIAIVLLTQEKTLQLFILIIKIHKHFSRTLLFLKIKANNYLFLKKRDL